MKCKFWVHPFVLWVYSFGDKWFSWDSSLSTWSIVQTSSRSLEPIYTWMRWKSYLTMPLYNMTLTRSYRHSSPLLHIYHVNLRLLMALIKLKSYLCITWHNKCLLDTVHKPLHLRYDHIYRRIYRILWYNHAKPRPCIYENIGSRSVTKMEWVLTWILLRCETTWEYSV